MTKNPLKILGAALLLLFTAIAFAFSDGLALYIKSDIREFQNKIFIINITVSVILSVFICFDKEEWRKYNKILILLGMLSFSGLFFYTTSEGITVCLLKFNSLSFDKTENREFKLYKESILEDGYFGTYTDKKYTFEGYGYDILRIEKEYENYIRSVDKVTLKLKIGLLGVPYDPQIIK